ncbi:YcxB family protein [Actinomadura sp. NPDC047616]|uniref:YcxB family protein n=1 Tax=Actinomadura sp. NPDC047616 TaxID=3155914 RepID=UPI0033EE5CEF
MDFTVDYQPSPDEVTRALGLGVNRQLRAFRLGLPAVLVLLGGACLLGDGASLGIGMFAGAVVAPFALGWAIRRMARRQVAYLCLPATVHVTSDGYEVRTDQSTTSMRWSLFGRIDSTPEFWLLFINRQFAAFLPKRAFDDDQRRELESLFAARQETTAGRAR